jgi:hypothetical protein
MRRVDPVLLALLAVGAVLTACSGSGGKTTSEAAPGSVQEAGDQRSEGTAAQPSTSDCPRADPKWPSRASPGFFPPSRAGLWVPAQGRCVYLVFPGDDKARPFWGGRPGEGVRGVAWAPDGQSVAITTKRHSWHVVVLRRDGAVLRRMAATGAAFFGDGRLVVSRQDGIDLLVDSRARRLASYEKLERVAGFRARRPLFLSNDPWGFTHGSGRDGLALTLWGGGGAWKSVVLIVSARGKVTRASPAYRTKGNEGVVYGWAWSPDGRELFVMAELPGPPARRQHGDHDHCLDVWSADRGRRRAFCESELPEAYQSHFSKLAWAADRKRGLLNNGTVLTRGGKVVGHAAVCDGERLNNAVACTFEVQWEPVARHQSPSRQ